MPDCLPAIEWSENEFVRSSKRCDLWQSQKSGQVRLEDGALDDFSLGLQFIIHRQPSLQKVAQKEINHYWRVAEQEWLGPKYVSKPRHLEFGPTLDFWVQSCKQSGHVSTRVAWHC